jgi:hypothetical protein
MAPTFDFRTILAACCVLACAEFAPAASSQVVEVDAARVLRTFERNPIGININHLMDSDVKRPANSRPLAAALKEMGVASLRFPEGELGDSYLWAVPPFPAEAAARPQWALRGPGLWPANDPRFSTPDFQPHPEIMGFDAFLDLAGATGAEPVIIVAYDSAYKKIGPGDTRPDLQQLITSAAAWVRYANVTKARGIRYWEIGNESDISPEAHSGGDPGAPQYAEDFVAFARAMKAEDPSIKIGINVCKNKRLAALLEFPALWTQVDFVSLHNYPTFGWKAGYETFVSSRPNLIGGIEEANTLLQNSALSSADKNRVEFLVTETNTIDWAKEGRWKNTADHGHALVMFDVIGQTLLQPRVSHLQHWVTRWIHNDETDRPLRVYDALTPDNQFTPMGHALSLWARHIGRHLVAATGTDKVHAYATISPADGRMAVFLLNKDLQPQRISLKLQNVAALQVDAIHQLSAATPQDTTSELVALPVSSRPLDGMELPSLSITVLLFAPAALPR